MIGQAQRLTELVKKEKTKTVKEKKILAITSGKGGTGKSFFALNYAYQLSSIGKKTLLIDLDSNLANIDLMLNETPEITISDFLQNRVLLKELTVNVRTNLDVIFGDSGKLKIPDRRIEIIDFLFSSIEQLKQNYDNIIIDTGAGIQYENLYLLSKTDYILLIINPDPTSVMDGYALTKLLTNEFGKKEIGVIVNKCDDDDEGKIAFQNINTATTHFLKAKLRYIGNLYFSPDVYSSIKEQVILSEENKTHPIVSQIKEIVKKQSVFR